MKLWRRFGIACSLSHRGETEAARRCTARGWLALTALLWFAIMLQAWNAPLYLDDHRQALFARNMGSWADAFGADAFGFFRPAKNLLFMLFVPLFEHGTGWARAVSASVALFSLSGVLAMSRRCFREPAPALFATALWALAPTLVSSVIWFSCVNILLMTGLCAWALCLHDLSLSDGATRPARLWQRAGAWLCLAAGLLCYEGAIAAIPVLVAFDVFLRPSRRFCRSAWRAYAGYLVLGAAYWAVRSRFNPLSGAQGNFASVTPGQISFASAWFTLRHIAAWVWPFSNMAVTASYRHGQVSTGALAASWAAIAALIGFAALGRRRYPEIAFGIAVLLLGFAPMSNLLAHRNGPWGDYYLTFAGIGLSLACAGAAWRAAAVSASAGRRLRGRLAWFFAITIVTFRLAAALYAVYWARAWNSPRALAERSVRAFPNAAQPLQALASLLVDAGELERAEAMIERGRRMAPSLDCFDPPHAVLLARSGRIDDARALAERYERRHPSDPWVHGFLGYLSEDFDGRPDLARERYRMAVVLEPWGQDTPFAARRLALLLVGEGRPDEAIALWTRLVRLVPDDIESHHNLAVALAETGDAARAAHHRAIAQRLHARRPGGDGDER